MKSLDRQEGGDHYKNMAIQPIEFTHYNKIPPCETGVIKYVCRHKAKNGAEDLKKAMHLLQFLLEADYGIICKLSYDNQDPEYADDAWQTAPKGEQV